MENQCEDVFAMLGYGSYRCQHPGRVQRDGKWYCGVHDPLRRINERLEDERMRAEAFFKKKDETCTWRKGKIGASGDVDYVVEYPPNKIIPYAERKVLHNPKVTPDVWTFGPLPKHPEE